MKHTLLTLLFFTISLQATPYQAVKTKVEQTIRHNKTVVVFFSKSSCSYCRYSLPIFHQAQRAFDGKAVFLLIDASEHATRLKKDFDFSTFPTFIYFVNGKKVLSHGSNNKTLTVAQMTQNLQSYC